MLNSIWTKKFFYFLLLIFFSVTAIADNVIRPFVSGSYTEILESRQQKQFVLILWSLDCPSCYKELAMIGALSQQYPEIDMVLVSTDIEATMSELNVIVKKYKLSNVESWVFSGDSDERLRFEIDRAWYGELPRSYLFESTGKKQVVSGILSQEKLLAWLRHQD